MSPTLDAFLRSWPWDPWLLACLALTAAVYLRGWLTLHRRDPLRWDASRPAYFLLGLGTVFLALGSPVEPFASLLLQVHMVQHMLLMVVAPPLLWLGTPFFPVLRGLPRGVRSAWVVPLLQAPAVRRLSRSLTHPVPAMLLFTGAVWVWHAPPLYQLALRSYFWHGVQHLCFLGSGLLFWFAILRPYPARPRWSAWLLLPVLLAADVQNTVLSAILTFADRPLYPHYAGVPRLAGISALDDQATAGVIMWVPGSIAFLVPLFAIGIRLLYGAETWVRGSEGRGLRAGAGLVAEGPALLARGGGRGQGGQQSPYPRAARATELPARRIPLVTLPPHRQPLPAAAGRFDLLRLPLLGPFLKWRHARLSLQVLLSCTALLVILDGLTGPQAAPMNLAGVVPWVHWRGLLVVGLLVAGNLFCMGCPFLLPRTLARRWLPARRTWPRVLRTKWLAVGLLAVFLWAYEAFALWDSPWLTAWVAFAYFAAAFAVDAFFRGASFCKYLCPVGQFNFVQSLVSPLEVRAKDRAVCDRCRTKDCIRGRDGIPGCELNLFVPRKAGNMDCTFCLDCVHACPHGNIGLLATPPARELTIDRQRSGIGRFSRRPDLAALAVLLTFGAFANAAGMVGPVAGRLEAWQRGLGLGSPLLPVTAYYAAALLLVPAALVFAAAALSRSLGGAGRARDLALRYSYALIPLGFAMWTAHYGFHFLTGYDTITPAAQRFAADHGFGLGQPQWVAACCRPVGDWLPRLEIVLLDLGFLLSLYAAYRVSLQLTTHWHRALAALAPWAALITALFALGVWIVLQPMQMRGMM